jgi:hypothetical protein
MKSTSSIVLSALFVCGALSTSTLSAPNVNDLVPLQKQGDRFLELVELNAVPSKEGEADLIAGAAFSENSDKNNNSQIAPSVRLRNCLPTA